MDPRSPTSAVLEKGSERDDRELSIVFPVEIGYRGRVRPESIPSCNSKSSGPATGGSTMDLEETELRAVLVRTQVTGGMGAGVRQEDCDE